MTTVSGAAKRLLLKSPLIIAFIGLVIVGSMLSPYFATGRNLQNIILTGSVVSVLAVGQFMVIVTAGIDLSVGAVAALATVISAILLREGMPTLPVVALTLAACAVVGLINGVLVVFGRITPFIATLAMLSIAQGAAFQAQVGTLIQITNQSFIEVFNGRAFGVPTPVLIAILTMLLFAGMMRWTTFGRQLYAIGGNREAARLSGIRVQRNLLAVYAISSLLAGLAGLMLAGQLQQGSSLVAQGYELNAIAATVVGGASLFGGTGTPVAAVVGGLFIGTVENIMNLRDIQSQTQLIIKGIIILIAVYLTSGAGAAISRRVRRLLPSRETPAAGADSPPASGNAATDERALTATSARST